MARLTDHFNLTITVDWDVKPQTKKAENMNIFSLKSGVYFMSCMADFSLYDIEL